MQTLLRGPPYPFGFLLRPRQDESFPGPFIFYQRRFRLGTCPVSLLEFCSPLFPSVFRCPEAHTFASWVVGGLPTRKENSGTAGMSLMSEQVWSVSGVQGSLAG